MSDRAQYQREIERLLAAIRELVDELDRLRADGVRAAGLAGRERLLGQRRAELAALVNVNEGLVEDAAVKRAAGRGPGERRARLLEPTRRAAFAAPRPIERSTR